MNDVGDVLHSLSPVVLGKAPGTDLQTMQWEVV
jgi:hypothetical protein